MCFFVAKLKQLSIFYYSVEHSKERQMLETTIQSESVNKMSLELKLGHRKFRRMIISYLIDTGISTRI